MPRDKTLYGGDAPDMIDETQERAHLTFLRRFDEVIWPTLYEGRGVTKGEAMLSWQLSYLHGEMEAMTAALDRIERS